jgi:hypothetical protein
MKQRSVSSIFWDKRIEHNYSVNTSYLYLYLITCKHIGLTPYFFLPDGFIPIETGLTQEAIKKCKADLEERGQVYFYNNWVYIPNANEHNSFNTSGKTMVAYEAQLAKVPQEVIGYFDKVNTVSDRVSIGYTDPILSGMDTRSNSNSSNNSNSNRGIVKGGDNKIQAEAKRVLDKWNEVYSTNFTATTSIETNLAKWLQVYTIEQILEGIPTTKLHHFWRDKLNPTIYLRKKNPRGEDVDYISEMLNYKPRKEFANASASDKYKNL